LFWFNLGQKETTYSTKKELKDQILSAGFRISFPGSGGNDKIKSSAKIFKN